MKLLSWNTACRHKKNPEQLRTIESEDVDILALQEVTKRTAPLFAAALPKLGLTHVVSSFDLASNPESLKGNRKYGELIASRWPIKAHPPTNFDVPWPERILSATIDTPFGLLELHTTHIPPGESNGWLKIEVLEGLYRGLAKQTQIPRILCGDFNAPQSELPDGTTVSWGSRIQADGTIRPSHIMYGQSGQRWRDGENNVIVGLAEYDLPDAFRTLHGFEKKAGSWLPKNSKVPHRLDHIFASAELNTIACDYIDTWRTAKLSDHAPVYAIFDPKVFSTTDTAE